MSKIGNVPIKIPDSITLTLEGNLINIKGKEGELNFEIPKVLKLEKEDDKLNIVAKNQEKKSKSLHGLYRQLIYNAVKGLESPWKIPRPCFIKIALKNYWWWIIRVIWPV